MLLVRASNGGHGAGPVPLYYSLIYSCNNGQRDRAIEHGPAARATGHGSSRLFKSSFMAADTVRQDRLIMGSFIRPLRCRYRGINRACVALRRHSTAPRSCLPACLISGPPAQQSQQSCVTTLVLYVSLSSIWCRQLGTGIWRIA
jgi:hypothetical protein